MAGLPLRRRAGDGASVIAVADGDREQAKAVADELAAEMWSVRRATVRRRARSRRRRCGGRSRRTRHAGRAGRPRATTSAAVRPATAPCSWPNLLRQKATGFVVALYAPAAVAAAKAAGIGGTFDATVGGAWTGCTATRSVRGVVRSLHDGKWIGRARPVTAAGG